MCAKLAGGPPGAKTVTYIWRSRGVTTEALRHDYQASLRFAALGNKKKIVHILYNDVQIS